MTAIPLEAVGPRFTVTPGAWWLTAPHLAPAVASLRQASGGFRIQRGGT
jgi:hypothetical protein